jgi:hypothetical protein
MLRKRKLGVVAIEYFIILRKSVLILDCANVCTVV